MPKDLPLLEGRYSGLMDAENIRSVLQARNGVIMDSKPEWDAFRFLLFGKMLAMLGFDKR